MSETDCQTCKMLSDAATIAENLWWVVLPRVIDVPVPGWTTIYARRHTRGPADMTNEEMDAFGPVIRAVSKVVLGATDAERVYVVSLNDPAEHLHVHMIPRYPGMPVSWESFDLVLQTRAGDLEPKDEEHARAIESIWAEFQVAPLQTSGS